MKSIRIMALEIKISELKKEIENLKEQLKK